MPARCGGLQACCLSHLQLWEREVPNAGSSLDHRDISPPASSHSDAGKPLAWQRLSGLQRYPAWNARINEEESWERYNLAFFSWHGSVTSCCQDPFLGELEHSTGSAGVEGIRQQFRHTPASPSACIFVCHGPVEFKGDITTTAPPRLSSAQTVQTPTSLAGRAKTQFWICFLQVCLVCEFLEVMSGHGMWISNSFSNFKHRSYVNPYAKLHKLISFRSNISHSDHES